MDPGLSLRSAWAHLRAAAPIVPSPRAASGARLSPVRRILPLLLLLVPASSSAQGQLLSYSLKPAVQTGAGSPQVFLEAQSDFDRITLDCERSDGESVSLAAGRTKRGTKRTFDLKQPAGSFRWTCTAMGWYGAGAEDFFDLPFRFESFVGGPLSITVPREEILIGGRMLSARADREVASAHLTVITPDGPVFDEDVAVDANEPGEELLLQWTGGGDEVLRIDVTLTDKWGFYAFENIFPWSLEIPHEDIHFATGSHDISAAELPKVNKAWGDVKTVIERYSQYVEVRLYVGGYTDTVGDRASNAGLSERRARSIAQAFRQLGFAGPLLYQGFGEDGLAIATDDSVDEVRNRRAVYLLASKPPPASPQLPRGNWKGL